ncbi:DUF1788 domain-containing protein [Paenibacillus polymyxa]|uniref:DUF1788 domain-containing protein n=1 Tax=Paenibacillus polymyxa TaxID=1406 RepID=UPI0025B6D3D3|nr:DUF1788 domain-containing protein [Paenibacillus polymyxa]MDN4076364.1 DUF1788 domain-containing protein [Paenibacillus polymyxa]MDN4101790.1 DUF1788 domain-containing protein [Paenibacillus polymyxa]MDN4112007.1 DUF1788 domain-containing protein [Paenibacillus polymyxa]
MANLNSRLDRIIPKIKEDKFIEGRGLGNEVSFYVFDYEPEKELLVRDYISHILKEFSYDGTNRKIIEFDLYKLLIEIAKEKRIYDRIPQMEEKQGKDALFKAMANFAKPDIFLQKIKEQIADNNVVFITGVGKVYPFVRSHNILNNLQEVLDKIPVIMFFPGKYDGLSLRLFDRFKDDNYYRAFRLVD